MFTGVVISGAGNRLEVRQAKRRVPLAIRVVQVVEDVERVCKDVFWARRRGWRVRWRRYGGFRFDRRLGGLDPRLIRLRPFAP